MAGDASDVHGDAIAWSSALRAARSRERSDMMAAHAPIAREVLTRDAMSRVAVAHAAIATCRRSVRSFSLSIAASCALVAIFFCGACAGPGTERNVAPVFSELSTAGGGTELEALGGILRVRRTRPGGPLRQWALRPLVIHDRESDGDSITRFLTPFGFSQSGGGEYTWQLLPIARYHEREFETGEKEWQFLSLPGIYWSRQPDGRVARAWFPFGGVMEHFLSWDRLVFVLFPLYVKTEQHGRTTKHFLFPIFSTMSGDPKEVREKKPETQRFLLEEGSGFRVWPLYGHQRVELSHEYYFALWPIFHWQHNELSNPPDKQEYKWLFLPLIGRTTRGSYRSTTVLWPFFGYAHDPKTGFHSWDGPWPIVRFYDDPVDDNHRMRIWPLYSSYHGDGLDSRWYLWPIINVRHEQYERAELDGLYVIPFWRSWKRTDLEAGESSFDKLWPFYQTERTAETYKRTAFPALNILWRTPEIDEMYAWLWELYTREKDHDLVHERTWLGLYRREKDVREDRISFTGLWATRRYHDNGEVVRETSLLFGLLRWRSRGSDSLQWLWPAFPGPGWPLERSTETEIPTD